MKNKNISRLYETLFFLWLLVPASLATASPVDAELSPKELFQRAVAMSVNSDWESAEKIFQKISLSHPGWPEPKNNLAIVLLKQGKVELAQQAIESAVISLPSFKVAQENRKRLYDHAAAIAYYKAVGDNTRPALPQLQLLREIYQPTAERIENTVAKKIKESLPEPRQSISNTIQNRVLSWSKSWSELNINQYLSSYSTQFRSSAGEQDYTQWSKVRRAKFRLAKNIHIELQDVKIYVHDNETQALAEFIQNYKSNKYQDKTVKQLSLILENDRWLIESERVLQQLN